MIQRVEIIMLKGKNKKEAQRLCHLSKNLYNAANYEMRKSFLNGKKKSNYQISTEFAKDNQSDYRALPAQCSQQIINLLEKNWKAFFKLAKDRKKNPKKYRGRPKLPRYKKKDGYNVLIITSQQLGCKLTKHGYLKLPKGIDLKIKTRIQLEQIQQIRIVPEATCFKCEIVYKKEIVKNENLNYENKISIDLGVNNLATMFINDEAFSSCIINGRPLKSINQFYNKKFSMLKSFVGDKTSKRIKNFTKRRNNKVKDYIHKVSRWIITFCENHRIGHLIIGKNDGWKQNSKMSKKVNQHFVGIPFEMLINQLIYKATDIGIIVTMTEESYTSKIDHLAGESFGHKEKYLGKRVHRGLFKSSTGKVINADVNGAIGIMRKVVGESLVKKIADSVGAFTPVIITP